jgi:hypothetical protein
MVDLDAGFRILAHRQGRAIGLITRNGHDLADRFPLAAEAVAALPVRSCVIDAEAIVCDDNRLAVFDLIRGHSRNGRLNLRPTSCRSFGTSRRPARVEEAGSLEPPLTFRLDF